MALNRVMLIGNAGKDPEIRFLETPERPKVAQFTLATTERYKAKDGSLQELTEWHNIVAWRGMADIVEKYVRKGSQVFIEGKLRTRSWEVNGQKFYRTEVMMERIQLLGGRQETAQGAQPAAGYAQAGRPQQAQPRPQQPAGTGSLFCPQQPQDMTAAQGMSYVQPTDDLPF